MRILFHFLNIIIFWVHIFAISQQLNFINEFEDLKEIFFDNLRVDPALLADNEVSEDSVTFIDAQIKNFLRLITETQENDLARSKRSLSDQPSLTNYTIDIEPYQTIPTVSPKDAVLFQQYSDWYAITLENKKGGGQELVIFKRQGESFREIKRQSNINGVCITVFTLQSSTFIVVAENCSESTNLKGNNTIYLFKEESLNPVQNINSTYSCDVVIWEKSEDILMSFVIHPPNCPKESQCEIQIPIYKWYGKHFDIVQHITTPYIRKIVTFSINDVYFMTLVNPKSTKPGSKEYSDILKYNHHTEKYEPHQRVTTNGCRDIAYFKIMLNANENHFLVVDSSYETGTSETKTKHSRKEAFIYKYVDYYFIPFQSIKIRNVVQWLPVTDNVGNTILFAITENGVKVFQYNGWRFMEFKTKLPEIFGNGLKTMHIYTVEEKQVIFVVNTYDNGSVTNIYEITFTSHNEIQKLHDKMLSWCLNGLKNWNSRNEMTDVVGKALRGDVNEEILDADEDEVEKLITLINTYNNLLQDYEKHVELYLKSPNTIFINSDVTAKLITVNKTANLQSLRTPIINKVDITNIMEDVLNIGEGFKIDTPLDFKLLFIEEQNFPKTINDVPFEEFLNINDDINIKNITITGTTEFKDGLFVNKKINHMVIDKKNILLLNEDQYFSEINASRIVSKNLKTKFLNKVNVVSINQGVNISKDVNNINILDQLEIKNVIINGLTNNVSIHVLEKNSLKKSGDQNVNSVYYFDIIETDHLKVKDSPSDKGIFSNILLKTGRKYSLRYDARFFKDLEASNLTAIESLNDIRVKKGQLDILLKDSEQVQNIQTMAFKNLDLSSPIRIQKKIKNKEMDTLNPVVTVVSNIEFNDDVILIGNVTVVDVLKSASIATQDQKYSLNRVVERGLKTNEPEIPVQMTFMQELILEELFVDKINNVDPTLWVITGGQQTQVIHGLKHFVGDLRINGPTNIININNIDVVALEGDALRKTGDQVITGKHSIQYVQALKGVASNSTIFGPYLWTDVIRTSGDQVITGMTLVKDNLLANATTVNVCQIDGLINNLDFKKIVNDAVMNNKEFKIFNHKTIANLTVDNLNVKNNDLIKRLKNFVAKNEIKLKGNMYLPNKIFVEEIFFTEKCNNIEKDHFGKKFENGVTPIIFNNDDFKRMTIFGKVQIDENRINDVNLTSLEHDTVKINEPHEFGSAIFSDAVVIPGKIQLEGNVEHLDIENIFGTNTDNETECDGKVFQENVTIDGYLITESLNGFNISDLCDFTSLETTSKTLIIQGNLFFTKGPNVFKLNGYDVPHMVENAWYFDSPVNISRYIQYGNVTFKNNVTIEGYVDNTKLELLSKNYFSKSKNQTIYANFLFDEVTFEKNVSTQKINLTGNLNGIDLKRFTETALLNNVAQVFENIPYLESCFVRDLKKDGYFSVNNLSLENDIMRYDKQNKVTGFKTIRDLDTDSLKIDHNITIHNVPILSWLQNSVLKNGSISISGHKIIKTADFKKGISLKGLLNHQNFNKKKVMLKSVSQTIKGKKIFIGGCRDLTTFKGLKVKGKINDIDLLDMTKNQAHKNRNNVFKSKMVFESNITTRDLNIRKLYRGVNVTELMMNISKLNSLEKVEDNYYNLLSISTEVENSLKDQAYFLKYYKENLFFPDSYKVFGITCDDGNTRLVVFSYANKESVITSFEWDVSQGGVLNKSGYKILLDSYPHHITDITIGNKQYIYFEERNQDWNAGAPYLAKLLHFANSTTLVQEILFSSNGTQFITSFDLPNLSKCLILITLDKYAINILCSPNERNIYSNFQTIPLRGAHTASIVRIDNILHLFVAKGVTEDEEPNINIWKLNEEIYKFESYQTIFEEDPKSLTTILYKNEAYLAVAYGHMENTMHLGKITIRRFNKHKNHFELWQNIHLDAPLHVQFEVLSSNELVLYILTESSTETFTVYVYEGVSGFKKKFAGLTIHKTLTMNCYSMKNQHFVAAQHREGVSIIQAMLKGKKCEN